MADLVTTTVNYGVPPADGVRAFFMVNPNFTINGDRGKNYTHEAHEVQLENIRGKEDTVSLDTAPLAALLLVFRLSLLSVGNPSKRHAPTMSISPLCPYQAIHHLAALMAVLCVLHSGSFKTPVSATPQVL